MTELFTKVCKLRYKGIYMICPTIKFVRKLSADAHSKWHVICPNFSLVGAISGLSRFDIWCVRLSFCMTGILTDQADDFSYGTLYVFMEIRFHKGATWSKSEFCWTILTSLQNLHEDIWTLPAACTVVKQWKQNDRINSSFQLYLTKLI